MSDIIDLAGIGSKNTYYSCLDELMGKGYLTYDKGNKHYAATFTLTVLSQELVFDYTLSELRKLSDEDLSENILKLNKLLNSKDISIDQFELLENQRQLFFKELSNRFKKPNKAPREKIENPDTGSSDPFEGLSELDIENWNAFTAWIKKNDYTRVQSLKKPLTPKEFVRLLNNKKYNVDLIRETFKKMENWQPLTKKSVSAFLTLINWMDTELKKEVYESRSSRSAR